MMYCVRDNVINCKWYVCLFISDISTVLYCIALLTMELSVMSVRSNNKPVG